MILFMFLGIILLLAFGVMVEAIDGGMAAIFFMVFVFIPAVAYSENVEEANNPNCSKCGKPKDCECK